MKAAPVGNIHTESNADGAHAQQIIFW